MQPYSSITLSQSGPIATLTLNRPDARNALHADMIAELHDGLVRAAEDQSVRVVVLAGAGSSFCAGADTDWLRSGLGWTAAQHTAAAEAQLALFDAAWSLPKPLIGQINGLALDAGVGLLACCDLAVAAETVRLGFRDVKLGLTGALLAPYVVPKIGVSHARALFVSGERITAERAFEIGLVHAIVSGQHLAATVTTLATRMLSGAPGAIAAAKRAVDAAWPLDRAMARQQAIDAYVAAWTGEEAHAGVRAFVEQQKPGWVD